MNSAADLVDWPSLYYYLSLIGKSLAPQDVLRHYSYCTLLL